MFEAGVTAWLVLILMARKSFPPIPLALCLPVCIAHYSAVLLASPGSMFTCTLTLNARVKMAKIKEGRSTAELYFPAKFDATDLLPLMSLQCLHAHVHVTHNVSMPPFL